MIPKEVHDKLFDKWGRYRPTRRKTMGYVPKFEPQATVTNTEGARKINMILNMDYYATDKTAMEMASMFGANHIEEEPYAGGSGGNLSTDAPAQRILVWADGLRMNAGKLAKFWINNPEDDFPGLAYKLAQGSINNAREFMQQMARNAEAGS